MECLDRTGNPSPARIPEPPWSVPVSAYRDRFARIRRFLTASMPLRTKSGGASPGLPCRRRRPPSRRLPRVPGGQLTAILSGSRTAPTRVRLAAPARVRTPAPDSRPFILDLAARAGVQFPPPARRRNLRPPVPAGYRRSPSFWSATPVRVSRLRLAGLNALHPVVVQAVDAAPGKPEYFLHVIGACSPGCSSRGWPTRSRRPRYQGGLHPA